MSASSGVTSVADKINESNVGLQVHPAEGDQSCQLLGPTALIVQGLMGILVILSLVYKRHREKPKRPWRIWLFDVSKQVVGQMFVHGANVLVSDLVSHEASGNACVFYFFNILIDTTIGVAFIYVILHALTHLFTETLHLKGFVSGIYGTPPSFQYWARQAAIYVLSLTTMKLIVIGLLVLFPGLFKIGEWLLRWTWREGGDSLQVIFTMGIFPIIMNIAQFWLIDSIVKASVGTSVALDSDIPNGIETYDRQPLFGAPSDDEDDDSQFMRNDVENPRTQIRSLSRLPSGDKSYPASVVQYEHRPNDSIISRSQTLELHSYPPSFSSSMASSSSQTSNNVAPNPTKTLVKQTKRRQPPAPLSLHPVHYPAVISSPNPLRINAPQQAKLHVPVPVVAQTSEQVLTNGSNKEWTESWDDSDWNTRAEEEWNERMVGDSQVTVDGDTWSGHQPVVQVVS